MAVLVFKRILVQRAMTILPEQYATVRGFFEKDSRRRSLAGGAGAK